MNLRNRTGKAFRLARERYAGIGVNVDLGLQALARILQILSDPRGASDL